MRPSGGFPIKAIAEHFAMTALSGMTTERGESAAKSARTQSNKKRAPATAA
jgi:hypothetical protein